MMALVTHQVQGSCAPSRPLSWKRGTELKQFLAAFPKARRTNIILLKHTSCLCLAAPLIHGSKWKPLRVSSFKGNVQDDESGGRASGSNSVKSSVKLSYVSQDSEETLSDVPKVQQIHAPSTSDSDETAVGSVAIQNLFKSWLTLLHMPSLSQVADKTLEGRGPSSDGSVETEHKILNSGKGEILKTVWCSLLGLDATIKIPVMIFIPMYLAVNMKYGVEIANELSPLWIGGPLFVALYIKMLQVICSLYLFSFRQSVNVLKKLPTYYHVAYDYVICGKLKEFIRVRLWQPLVDFSNLDYIEAFKKTWTNFQGWLGDKYLDYVESIWPSYCKLIRLLKAANFI